MIANTVRAPRLEAALRYLAKDPPRFARAVRAAAFGLGAELHPLRWFLDVRPETMDQREVEVRALAMSDGAILITEGARLGLDELRALIARFERDACTAHRAKLVVVAAKGGKARRNPRNPTPAQWPAGERCLAVPQNEAPAPLDDVTVLAEKAGKRFVLVCSVITDRAGVAHPSVSFKLQRHREYLGWVSVGRTMFFPWDSHAIVRAALDHAAAKALAANEARARREHAEFEP